MAGNAARKLFCGMHPFRVWRYGFALGGRCGACVRRRTGRRRFDWRYACWRWRAALVLCANRRADDNAAAITAVDSSSFFIWRIPLAFRARVAGLRSLLARTKYSSHTFRCKHGRLAIGGRAVARSRRFVFSVCGARDVHLIPDWPELLAELFLATFTAPQ